MKVKMLQSDIEKNTLPVNPVSHTGKATYETKSENKIVAPFCEFCSPVSSAEKHHLNVFPDKYGFLWSCQIPLSCPHAITEGPVIVDCMILRSILKAVPGNPHDIDPRFRTKRRKLRAQLSKELNLIRGIRSAVV